MDKLYHLIAGCIIALVVGSALFYLIGCTPNFSSGGIHFDCGVQD